MVEVKPKEEEGPLMTKKQKKEFERIQQWKESKKNRESGKPIIPEKAENRIPKVSSAQTNDHRIKPSRDTNQLPSKPIIPNKSATVDKFSNSLPKSVQNMKPRDKEVVHKNPSQVQKSSSLKPEISSNKLDSSKQKLLPPSLPNSVPRKKPESTMIVNKKPQPVKETERKSVSSKATLGNSNSQSTSKPIAKSIENITNHKKDVTINNGSRELQKPRVLNMKEREIPSKNIQPTKKAPPSNDLKPKHLPPKDLKPKQFPQPDLKPKQFPPADLKPKQFPPPDVRRREFPPKDVKRKPSVATKRMYSFILQPYI